ncbi:MAG TPA: M48 family metallopeptidase [Gallionellaceae bacterium]|nr:M48 family metallopeptidase [Gallionellaceae bacterium]
MDNTQFESLILRLEKVARDSPKRYLASVLGVAMLGFGVLALAILYALAPAALLAGLAVVVVLTGGKALLLLLTLGKLLLVLVIPAWLMIKSSVQMLFARFPRPAGRALQPSEAPALFARLNELRARMRGPRIHHVLLTDELNAAIVQHPRFGLFGWEENYLILGFQYLQIMSEQEALSVVAHEYGHLAGQHSRLGGFIYRFRSAWGRMQALSDQWTDRGSRAVSRLFHWYAPYFNAYTFVLARQNEYIADRTAAEVAGADNAANALMRGAIAAQFEDEVFWPAVDRMVADHPRPIADRAALWTKTIAERLDEPARLRYLEAARDARTGYLDTHPALADRLRAIGITADAEAARQLTPPARAAADAWLGGALPAIQAEFDLAWQAHAGDYWEQRHQQLEECRAGLAELQRKPELTPDERWQAIKYTRDLDPGADLMPQLDELLRIQPDHAPALHRRALILLARSDEAGIADLERLMERDPEATLDACEAAWQYYRERDPERADQYRARWIARADHEEDVANELRTLPPDATLEPHNLDDAAVAQIREIVERYGKHVKRAYLLRRVLKADSALGDYVLAFETAGFRQAEKGQETVKALAAQKFPAATFLVPLASKTYKIFRYRIGDLGIEPLYVR